MNGAARAFGGVLQSGDMNEPPPSSIGERIEALVAEILALEQVFATRDGDTDELASRPGPGAREEDLAAIERFHARTLPDDYRTFLARHDGWKGFAWGTWLYTTAELHGDAYTRGFIDDDMDEPLPPELDEAVVIGASENDASVVMLLPSGAIVEWLYDETCRWPSFVAYLDGRRDTLRGMLEAGNAVRAKVATEWEPALRARRDALVEAEIAALVASAGPRAPVARPSNASPTASSPEPAALQIERAGKIVGRVNLQLQLFLGAYPSPDEVTATFRAFRARFPVAGKLGWMHARAYAFGLTEAPHPDDEGFRAGLMPDDTGHFGLRAQVDPGDGDVYTLNVRGVPAANDDEATARASFCEVLAPASASPAAMLALVEDLARILPVRSGHVGYAPYATGSAARDAEVREQLFTWHRRFFALNAGPIDGFLPGALSRVVTASWVTVLGPCFARALEATLADLPPTVTPRRVPVSSGGAALVLVAGTAPTLGDLAAEGYPEAIASVAAALAPVALTRVYETGTLKLGARWFTTQSEEVEPFVAHSATRAFLARYLAPDAFAGPSVREQAEDFLARVSAAASDATWKDRWEAEKRGGRAWAFGTLLDFLGNATRGAPGADVSLEALAFALGFEDGHPDVIAGRYLYGCLQRNAMDAARSILPRALAIALARSESSGAKVIYWNAACCLARMNDEDGVYAMFEAAKRVGGDLAAMAADDDLAALAATPRFRAFTSPA